jgi:hypothetical protein
MRDFTIRVFELLCLSLRKSGHEFITFSEYCLGKEEEKFVIMRHDVDKSWVRALRMAEIEAKDRIRATYYFRSKKKCFNEMAIKRIKELGHEIGYHYEDLSKAEGNFENAIMRFQQNLDRFRAIVPIKTICMHGNPISKWDNRLLWQKFRYRDFDIIGEPFIDIDYDKVLYLTDTGRKWDGDRLRVRDKVATQLNYHFRSTFHIIDDLYNMRLPDQLMVNVHPHRWVNNHLAWFTELIWQNIKNAIKKYFFVKRTSLPG